MPHVIDHEKDRSGVLVRLSEETTGCSVAELLRMAENGEVLLFAALRKFSAVSQNTLGERHPVFPWMKTHGQDVELLPMYARDIRVFGQAEITHFPADLPDICDESLWFWRLEEPQTINIENLFIADGHVSNLPAQGARFGTTDPKDRRGVTSKGIIEGFLLDGKDWESLLSHSNSDGKRFKPALVQAGKQGKGGAALWSPIVFARLLINEGELNKGQVIARFKKAWPQFEDEMLAEIGEI